MSATNRAVWQKKWEGRQEPVNAFAKSLVRKLGEGRSRKILDVGCGSGVDSLYFARHGYAVTATDFSRSGIEILRRRADEDHLKIDASLHDTAKTFRFPDRSFDVIYAHLALHYFDDRTTRKVFAEMRRLLKPKGVFFVKCKSTKDCQYGTGEQVGPDMFRDGHVRHFFTPAYMKAMLEGFTVRSLRSSASAYHGKRSAFVAAVATR